MVESQAAVVAELREGFRGVRRELDQSTESRRVMHEKLDKVLEQNAKQDETIALTGQLVGQLRIMMQENEATVEAKITRAREELNARIDGLTKDINENIKPVTDQVRTTLTFGRWAVVGLGAVGLTGGTVFAVAGNAIRRWLFHTPV